MTELTDEQINDLTAQQGSPVYGRALQAHRDFARAIIAQHEAQRQAGQERPAIPTAMTLAPRGMSWHGQELRNDETGKSVRQYTQDTVENLAAEVDAKAAEIAQLQDQNTSLDKALAAQAAEIAALKADAARYRYLRGFERTTVATETEDLVWASCFDTQDGLDIAIDEAMAQAVQP